MVSSLGPDIHLFLFLGKIPFLVCDFAIAYLLYQLFDDRKKSSLALKFWMINPLGIYTSYIFGQFDIIPTVFVVVSLYFAKKRRYYASFLSLGIGASFKLYPLLFTIPLAIIVSKGESKMKLLKYLSCSFIPYAIPMIPYMWPGIILQTTAAPGAAFLLNFKIHIFYFDWLYPYVILYGLIVLYAYYHDNWSFEETWKLLLVILLLYFSTSHFHPQFFVWITPFIALWLAHERRIALLHAGQVLCFFIYTFYWGRPMAMYLFAPINSTFFDLSSPREIMLSFVPEQAVEIFIAIFRNILSAISLWMVAQILGKNILKRYIFKRPVDINKP
jgi:hypothetical protein